jgi:hypothetical protein
MEVHYENFNDKYYIQHVFLGQGYSQWLRPFSIRMLLDSTHFSEAQVQ